MFTHLNYGITFMLSLSILGPLAYILQDEYLGDFDFKRTLMIYLSLDYIFMKHKEQTKDDIEIIGQDYEDYYLSDSER